MSVIPGNWDMEPPLNINDGQIWPGMTEKPEERKGATEMIFCLARSTVGNYFLRIGMLMQRAGGDTEQSQALDQDIEMLINEAETEVEEKYIRYCDVTDPLHFLTVASARSAITAMRLRSRLAKSKNQSITDSDKKEMFHLSQKIMDTDAAAYAHTSLSQYMWHVKSFFVWGSWDSLVFVLTTLRNSDLLSLDETTAAWKRVEQMHINHHELLESNQALHVALRRLTLSAWDHNPQSKTSSEPAFITTLRLKVTSSIRGKSKSSLLNTAAEGVALPDLFSPSRESHVFNNVGDDIELGQSDAFDIDTADWEFWDRLIKSYQPPVDP